LHGSQRADIFLSIKIISLFEKSGMRAREIQRNTFDYFTIRLKIKIHEIRRHHYCCCFFVYLRGVSMHFRSDRVQIWGEFYIARRMVLVGVNNRLVKTRETRKSTHLQTTPTKYSVFMM